MKNCKCGWPIDGEFEHSECIQEINKDVLRAELLEVDVLYAKYQEAKHGHPYKEFTQEFRAFEAFRDSLVDKYGMNLTDLRAEALTPNELAFVQFLLGHAVNLRSKN